jgi:hypothetical protein
LQSELLDRLGHLLAAPGVPGAAAFAQRPRDRLQAAGRTRDGLLGRHKRRPAEHAARAEEVLRRRSLVAAREQLQSVETLTGFEREEIRCGEGIGHRK